MLLLSWGVKDAQIIRQSICGYFVLKGYFSSQPLTTFTNKIEVKLAKDEMQSLINNIKEHGDTYRNCRYIDTYEGSMAGSCTELINTLVEQFADLETVYMTVPLALGVKSRVQYTNGEKIKMLFGSLGVVIDLKNSIDHENFAVYLNGVVVDSFCPLCRLNPLKLNGICLYYNDQLQCLLNTQRDIKIDMTARILVAANGHGVKIEDTDDDPDALNSGNGVYYV